MRIAHPTLTLSLVALALAHPHPHQQRSNLDPFYISASLWAEDVAQVSQFLDDALARKISASNLVSRANDALHFELDELNHKHKIDADSTFNILGAIIDANRTLEADKKFNDVVDALEGIRDNNNFENLATDVQGINAGRCKFVLPAIQSYFHVVHANTPGSEVIIARLPEACQKP